MSNIVTCLSKALDKILTKSQHCQSHGLLKPCSLLESVTAWHRLIPVWQGIIPWDPLPMGTNSVQRLYLSLGNLWVIPQLSPRERIWICRRLWHARRSHLAMQKGFSESAWLVQELRVTSFRSVHCWYQSSGWGNVSASSIWSQPWIWWVSWIQDLVQSHCGLV